MCGMRKQDKHLSEGVVSRCIIISSKARKQKVNYLYADFQKFNFSVLNSVL